LEIYISCVQRVSGIRYIQSLVVTLELILDIMKVLCFLAVFGFCSVLANDVIWMELMSASIVDASGYKTQAETDKTIPELAADLGLKILVDLVKKADLADALSGEGMY